MLILEISSPKNKVPRIVILGPNHTIEKGADDIAVITDHSRGVHIHTGDKYEDLVYRISTITSVARLAKH
ncbi:hypothetical protein My1_058 [Pectobacterium phage My1]|uniref:Uncharacterized protein n=1 Tax=Pectobacterium phage My1 TaxID=1204539 RepID=J9QNW2_9CAUD|nr:hypothetical protein My1_058 [Pectobacterium phage My1]AFQ22217.1 hypothetical protein My1_058 [Pectobacterium phage My1]